MPTTLETIDHNQQAAGLHEAAMAASQAHVQPELGRSALRNHFEPYESYQQGQAYNPNESVAQTGGGGSHVDTRAHFELYEPYEPGQAYLK